MKTVEARVEVLLERLPELAPAWRETLRAEMMSAIATDRAEINSEIQRLMGVLQSVREADLAKLRRDVEDMLYPKR